MKACQITSVIQVYKKQSRIWMRTNGRGDDSGKDRFHPNGESPTNDSNH